MEETPTRAIKLVLTTHPGRVSKFRTVPERIRLLRALILGHSRSLHPPLTHTHRTNLPTF